MNEQQIIDSIRASFLSRFPQGYFAGAVVTSLGRYIGVEIGLIGDKERVPNKIRLNDPMRHAWVIHIESDGSYEVTLATGSLSVNPREKYYAMSSVKTGWRKTTGDGAKIAKAFDRFFDKLAGVVKENKSDIYGGEKILDLIP